ncbi:MAG: SMC-Scp complex subunit ScpB [Elusimicrobia bacterium]|nr:SMC-Scp complex subunit ScpB [Elusimicrobiota bacterium]
METEELKKTLETLLFITDRPLGLAELCKITGIKEQPQVESAIARIREDMEQKGSAIQLMEVAEGFQMATRPAYFAHVRKLFTERMTMRLSTAALETLSIIAYKQPLTRAEIEEIRGVEVIAALETLLEKHLVRVVGRKETVGRPLMYGTTPDFLRHFGLRSLENLPPLDSFTPSEVAVEAAAAQPAQADSTLPPQPLWPVEPDQPSDEDPPSV